jgi:uncharacterized protein
VTHVLITGGSDGIGLAIARLLAAEDGARVTLVARNEEKLMDAVAQLQGGDHDFLVADLTQPGGLDLVVQRLGARHYDVLINNAGAGLYGRFVDLALDEQLRMLRLNIESVTVLSHAYLRRAQPGDALINTGSFLAYAPLPGAAAYSAAKAFVVALSEALWWESKERDVYVLAFNPGVITTRFHGLAGSSVAAFPRILIQSPESAAQEIAAALRRRRSPSVVTGFATRLMIRLQRLVSRKRAISMMGRRSP